MYSIYELVTLEVQNEHDYEHRPHFNEPKIYDADGDMNKGWHVYFSYRNPKTGKLDRMMNIYGTANKFKTKADRYSLLRVFKKRLMHMLFCLVNAFFGSIIGFLVGFKVKFV